MRIDITDPDLSPGQWAAALTPELLAHHLRRIAGDPHCMNADERAAVLNRAALIVETVIS